MSETFPRVGHCYRGHLRIRPGHGRKVHQRWIRCRGVRRELSPSGVRVSLVEPGACLTGFQSIAGYSDDIIRTMTDQYGPLLDVNVIADTIHYIVSQPPHVHLCDVVVRPTRMNYP